MAPEHKISQNSLGELSDAHKDIIKQHFGEKDIVVYSLPGGNVCVPTLETTESEDSFTHVMNEKVGLLFKTP